MNAKGEEPIQVLCNQCQRPTHHDVVASYRQDGDADGGEIWWSDTYRIVRCRGCDSVSIQTAYRHSEELDPETGEMEVATRTYPPRLAGVRQMGSEVFAWLPYDLWRIHDEVVKAFHSEAPILATVGLRAIIEGVCRDKGATGRNLQSKIKQLVADGVLPQQHADFLDLHRQFGNAAVHDLQAPGDSELLALFEIVEQLLKATYEIPYKARLLRRRRDQAAADS
ncbi:MAG: DUF4145 domain-containing protein [Dehalococcoidia bacterium]|nr:DUF4145 domain-containing protein [Dehalococcoidia bacterium]